MTNLINVLFALELGLLLTHEMDVEWQHFF